MSSITRPNVLPVFLFGLILAITGCSDGKSGSFVDPDTGKHATGWADPGMHGTRAIAAASEGGMAGCQECHAADFSGGISQTPCSPCHGGSAPHPSAWLTGVRKHSNADPGNAPVCALCHANGANSPLQPASPGPAGTPAGCFNNTLCHDQNIGHAPGWNDPTAHGAAAKQAPGVSLMQGFSGCSTCHGADFAGSTAQSCLDTLGCHGVGVNAPHASPWTSTSTYKHSETNEGNAAVCALCHLGNPVIPVYAPLPGGTTIAGCADGQICHTAGSFGCTGCHASEKSAPNASIASGGTVTSRRPVVSEFQQTWSHKRSGGNAVTDQDCGVCHMEGSAADGSRNLSYHGNGTIELRDPDTGAAIEGVAFTPANGTDPGGYASTGAPLSFVRFSRDLSATLESDPDFETVAAIQINHCLKCHDADGALNSASRVTGGSAEKPFATTISGTGYSGTGLYAGLTANNVAGGVTNIADSFATTNSSYHPVRGKQNNTYTDDDKMAAPWNGIGKIEGGTLTQWGYLISCWDCHAPSGATGVQTFTVTAHGSAATARGSIYVNNMTLCTICHTGYNSSGHGGAASAFSNVNGNMVGQGFMTQCTACHSSQENTAVVRPVRAEDIHGNNRLRKQASATDLQWPVGTTETYPPYAFIRAGFTTQHKPLSGTGVPAGSATCSGYGSTVCSRGSMGNYSPGGVF